MDGKDRKNCTKSTSTKQQLTISLPCSRFLQKFVIKDKLDLKWKTGFDLIEAEFTDCKIVLVGAHEKGSGSVQNVKNVISQITSGILEEKLEFPEKIQRKFWEKRRVKINHFLRSKCPDVEVELLEKENEILIQGRDSEEIELVRKFICQILDQLIAPPLPREKSEKKSSPNDSIPSVKLHLKQIHNFHNCTWASCTCHNFKSFCEALNDQNQKGVKLTGEKIFVEKLKDQYKIKFKLASDLRLEIKGRYCEIVKFEILDRYFTWVQIDWAKPSNKYEHLAITQDQFELFSDWREFWNKYQIFVKLFKSNYYDNLNGNHYIKIQYNVGNEKVEDFKKYFETLQVNLDASNTSKNEPKSKIQVKKFDPRHNDENQDTLFQHSLKRKPHLNKNLTNTDFNLNL